MLATALAKMIDLSPEEYPVSGKSERPRIESKFSKSKLAQRTGCVLGLK